MSPHTALVVVDMQNYFESMTKTALPNIARLSKFFASQSLPQLFTQHGHPPSDFKPPITNQLVRKWGKSGSIHVDTADWELMPAIAELATSASAPIVSKNTYDAFLNTRLEETLNEMGVARVVICGVMTDCCCETTGRSAFNRGFETWMVGDACGSVTRLQHEASLKTWSFGFGDVVNTEKALMRLRAVE